MQHIDVKQLKSLLDSDDHIPLLLDVREPREFEICHIQGSKLVPMREIPNAVSDMDPTSATVVICHTGMRSMQVCLFLKQSGFNNIYNLTGGVHAWANEIDSNMATY